MTNSSPVSRLDAVATPDGRLAILAIDQRGTLRSMLQATAMPSTDADLSAFKVELVAALSPYASGVLLDNEYGTGPVNEVHALAEGTGLLVSSELSPGPKHGSEPVNVYIPERGPAWIAEQGGAALKFLVRWRPDRPVVFGTRDLTAETMEAVAAAIAACRSAGMPAVIEPLISKLPDEGSLASDYLADLVVESARRLATLQPDLLKLEWPGDAARCETITADLGAVPWALLSAGVEFEQFCDRVVTALDAGAVGFIAGRAIWGEAAGLFGQARTEFFTQTAAPRLQHLTGLLEGRGKSWREVSGT